MRTRYVVAVAAALVGTAGVVAAPAQASGSVGKCGTAAGVSVVVDYHDLGPATTTRCAPPRSGQAAFGGTALQALTGAGYTATGTQRWGSAFVCRINGKPSPTQVVPIPGNPSYTEKCIDTPPAAAYWSLWIAANGGSWKLASYGATTQQVKGGMWEGWSFSHNKSSAPPPRVTPKR